MFRETSVGLRICVTALNSPARFRGLNNTRAFYSASKTFPRRKNLTTLPEFEKQSRGPKRTYRFLSTNCTERDERGFLSTRGSAFFCSCKLLETYFLLNYKWSRSPQSQRKFFSRSNPLCLTCIYHASSHFKLIFEKLFKMWRNV